MKVLKRRLTQIGADYNLFKTIIVLLLVFTACMEVWAFQSGSLESFVAARYRYRPYHYQTPQAWNRIRLEVADPGKVVWPLVEQEPRFMYLTGYWKGLIPSPVPGNTYLFKGLEDVGGIYELLVRPDAHGYIVYPIWLEEQIKLSKDKNFEKYIISKGFMNTLVTDLIYDVEEHLDYIVYNPDSVPEKATPPEVYGNDYTRWALSEDNYNMYNLKNYYCYFDNRSDSVRYKVKYTTQVTKAFDTEVDQLSARLASADPLYTIIPYWMTDVYLALPKEKTARMKRFGYLAYVINPLSGGVELTNNWSSLNVMDFAPYVQMNYDLVAYCGDSHSTNTFLSNTDAHLQFIYSVFEPATGMINRNGFDHKPSGLNVYIPEFDFKEKRGLTQFIKSLSLVMDSLVVDSGKKYAKLDLSVTLPYQSATGESNFISGLQCFVDTVYFADFDEYGLASKIRYSDGSIDTSSVISRFVNPFYLFRIPYKTIHPGENDTDLLELASCDYDTGMWGLFFFIDILLILSLLTFVFLRYTSPLVYRYTELYPTGVTLCMITLVMEICIFFFFTIEALSPQVIFFDLQVSSRTYLFLIALPILPIFLYFLFRYLYKEQPIP
ncbi:hypothetical protein [Bacteroides sp. 51]|uniref:hypothetical protein n=1 Tax=Bacteroides sp. 51 TaxID=2302938 RepID=UPI0013D0E625|nr:hypothetical protein [Bacteroides sp. 51]NDV82951.1 hypothetical protein [Bacteroides sp. 51]